MRLMSSFLCTTDENCLISCEWNEIIKLGTDADSKWRLLSSWVNIVTFFYFVILISGCESLCALVMSDPFINQYIVRLKITVKLFMRILTCLNRLFVYPLHCWRVNGLASGVCVTSMSKWAIIVNDTLNLHSNDHFLFLCQ